jgi:hypothetical protein
MSNNDLYCNKCNAQHHPADECGYLFDYKKQCEILEKQLDKAVTLIDGCYAIVELFTVYDGHYNKEWKRNWLREARKLGASGE